MYLEKTLKDYLKLIATESPYPGSGSSMAFCGALSASLLIMYFRMLQDELKQEEKLELNKIFSEVQQIKDELEKTIEEDPALCKRFSKPKETAIKEAALIPLLVAQKCNKLLELVISLDEEIKIYSRTYKIGLFPELIAGVYNAYTGIVGSLECVKKNLEDLEKGELRDYLLAERSRLEKLGRDNYNKILYNLKE